MKTNAILIAAIVLMSNAAIEQSNAKPVHRVVVTDYGDHRWEDGQHQSYSSRDRQMRLVWRAVCSLSPRGHFSAVRSF